MGSLTTPSIPIMDLTKADLKPGTACWLSMCSDIRNSLEEFGIFVVEYDKITSKLQEEIFGALEELFSLPLETKIQNSYAKPLHGYVGQHAVLPLHEGLGIDNAASLEGIRAFANLMWPCGNDRFCDSTLYACVSESLHAFTKVLSELEVLITRMIFESYGVLEYYDSHYEPMSYLLRVMRYRVPRVDETKLGFAPHCDKSFTTIVYQNQVDGLMVETKNGEWIDVKLSPSSFAFIAGDAIMAWSNGRIQSPIHRVTMNASKTRYSLGFFSFSDGNIQVPKEMIDDQNPLRYRSFEHLDYLRFYISNDPMNRRPLNLYCGI